MKLKLESRLLGEISMTSLMTESEEELKSLLMKVKEESEKADLKFSIQKTKIMASGPIISWQIDGKKIERKAMANLDNILKSRDITLPIKILIVEAIVFPVVMYRCQS